MTTDITTEKTPSVLHPVRILAMLGALAAIVITLVAIPSAANAAPVNVSIGDRIVAAPGEIAGCNIALAKPGKIATAGHCFDPNDPVYTANGVYIGKASVSSGNQMTGVSSHFSDYAIVDLAPNVTVVNRLGISDAAAPQTHENVYKHGHGLGIGNIEATGKIIAVTPQGIVIDNMAATFFDSGSPMIVTRGGQKYVVGIASGATTLTDSMLNLLKALKIVPRAGLSVATNITSIPW